MYVPPHFAIEDPAEAAALIEAHSFGILVSDTETGMEATHIPFLLRRDEAGGPAALLGHVARANPHWKAFDAARRAMVLFQGPHAYVSPGWYPAGKKVPTWNYVAVHVYGTPRIMEDAAAVRALLEEMVATYEAGSPEPWSLDGQPEDYLDAMQKGTVAFEIPVERVDAKAKLSQNHPEGNRTGAIAGLRAQGTPDGLAIAELMDAALRRD